MIVTQVKIFSSNLYSLEDQINQWLKSTGVAIDRIVYTDKHILIFYKAEFGAT